MQYLMCNISNFDSIPVDTEDYSGVGGTVNNSTVTDNVRKTQAFCAK